MKYFRILLFLFLTVGGSLAAKAQDNKSPDMKAIIESQNYIFKAKTVYPQNGRTRQLTDEYDLTVAKDKVVSFLPYFGKAYSAPIGSSEGGIKFTSADFEYNSKKTSKGWEITIKPKDAYDVQQLYLTVFENGSANLRVNSTNRQAISFDGQIVEGKKKAF